jgi:predicted ATPase
VPDPDLYPFSLPFLGDGFILDFDRETTVILGENGTGEIDDAPRHRRACRA